MLGRRLTLREQPFTIVGVMPADFEYPRGVEAWMTVEAMASLTATTFRETIRRELDLIARLRPGATRAQALQELEALVPRLEGDPKLEIPRGLAPVMRSYEEVVVGDVRPALIVSFAAVGFVLLIASANVANLLLLRGEERRSELAVRAALGASRGRIASQLLAESALLALWAGLVGLAGSGWVLRGLVAFVPGGLPRVDSVRIDGAVVLFTVAAAFVSAALAGVAPALNAGRADLAGQLRPGRQPHAAGARQGHRTLIAAQVALAVTVLAVGALLTRSLLGLQHVDLGLSPERLHLVSLTPPREEADASARRHFQFLDDVVARLIGVPGVENATPLTTPPFAGTSGWDAPSWIAEGQSREQAAANPSLNLEAVYPNHFATLQIGLVAGRAFTLRDQPGAPEAAIVSADVAARVWPGQDPIGRRLRLGSTDDQPWRTIVGVVKTTRSASLPSLAPAPTCLGPSSWSRRTPSS